MLLKKELTIPIDIWNTRTFHRRLYSGLGMLKSITLLKRGDDQAEGTVTAYKLFECRHSIISKSDQPIQNDMSASYRVVWHIPRIELDRIGVSYINALDRISEISDTGKVLRMWQPESTNQITEKLFENHVCIDCVLLSGVPT